MLLKSKTAVITGCNKGIGKKILEVFSANGAAVFACVRNMWNPFDKNHEKILGCTTVNRLYITPIGDVLVCPYVHIKIGNIFESSLKEIVDYGFSIKYFRNHSDLCLAGEDKEFIKKFMTKSGQTIFKPALAKDIFSKDDFVS